MSESDSNAPLESSQSNRNEKFLGASNAHMSEFRLAQMKANVEAGYNPGGYGRLPGVEAPEFVPEEPVDEAVKEEPFEASKDLIRGVPEHLRVADEDMWVPPSRSSGITPDN